MTLLSILRPGPLGVSIAGATANDAGRSFESVYTDIVVTTSKAVNASAAGWTVTIDGVVHTPVLIGSGSNTTTFTLRINHVARYGDVIRLNYDQATGTTVAPDDGTEISATNHAVTNSLSKRLRLTLRNRTNELIASTTLRYALFAYASGNVADASWMLRESSGLATTDANGLLDIEYVGSGNVGETRYIAIESPSVGPVESATWTVAVA